jgi:flagellar biosynthesis/type III secretory pathway protein FliH
MRVSLHAPLVGVRLHPAEEAAAAAPEAAWLIELGARERARAERDAALAAVLDTLTEAAQAVPAMVGARLDALAAEVAELALAVAGEIVAVARERGLVDPVPIVARCLREAIDGSARAALHVYLSPDDHAAVLGAIGEDPDLQRRAAGVTFTPDPALERGTVRAESGAGRLVWDPSEVFARIAGEIRKGCAP